MNPKSLPGYRQPTPQRDCTKHSQWEAWLAWYGKNYTTYIPLRDGEPVNLDTLLSWATWCEAKGDPWI